MRTIFLGERYAPRLHEALLSHDFKPFYLPANPNVDPLLAFHADLSLIKLPNRIIIAARHLCENSAFSDEIANAGYTLVQAEREQKAAYPHDISLCACAVGARLFCRSDMCDPAILSTFTGEVISVSQGYAKCGICVLCDGAIITSDAGIARAAEGKGIINLLISHGGIELSGFEEGFVGGASFSCGDKLYLTGSIENHPSANEISAFASAHKAEVISLTSEPIFDIGGAVIL